MSSTPATAAGAARVAEIDEVKVAEESVLVVAEEDGVAGCSFR